MCNKIKVPNATVALFPPFRLLNLVLCCTSLSQLIISAIPECEVCVTLLIYLKHTYLLSL